MASAGVVAQIIRSALKGALAASAAEWRRAREKCECSLRAVSLEHSDDEELTAPPPAAYAAPHLLRGLVAIGALPRRDGSSEAASGDARSGWRAPRRRMMAARLPPRGPR